MGRHKKVECRICLKTMRSDILERHMKKHEKKSNGIEEAGSSGSGVCENVGKHKQVECRICLKTMRSDNLVRHMKTHEKKTNGMDVVTEKIEYNSKIDDIALENKIMNDANEYRRKLELGRKVKEIALKNDIPAASLSKDNKEALELFENRGQEKEIEAVEWRPWQMDILEYVNNPTKRRIIWIVGKNGNEGKTFFQDKIEEQYGRHRVFQMELDESSRDILHIMKKCVDMQTDIFLFNITKSVYINDVNYKILEKIKDGKATSIKYHAKKMRFKTPNVILVFSNMYPNTREFSEDRWLIFKINAKMELVDVTTETMKKKKEVNDAQKKSYTDWRKKTIYDRINK